MKEITKEYKGRYITRKDYIEKLNKNIINNLIIRISIYLHNFNYMSNELKNSHILNNINGYALDKQQRLAVVSDEDNTLIVAGAGSGKTLTMVGKIIYLIEIKNIKEEEILCISFTNESTKSLHKAINKNKEYKVKVKTFHKLALDIISKSNKKYNISPPETLELIIEEYFSIEIKNDEKYLYYLMEYLKHFYKEPKLEEEYLTNLKRVIITFINTFKANGMKKEDFIKLFTRKNNKKNTLLLLLIYKIYSLYQEELNNNHEVDFNDMIDIASQLIKEKKVILNYKYILIDEYQDTSTTRYLLIKAIIDNTSSKLIVVGDDFQSIYAFTGCNLNIFLNFKKYFGYTKILKIENTYRCSKELINVAGKFVMKNKKQLRKSLKSSKSIKKPIVMCIYNNFIRKLEKVINHIYSKSKEPILILGRNNKDLLLLSDNNIFSIKDNKITYNLNKEINIYYLTTHKSKGLEAENVIIINLINDTVGFPNKIPDLDIVKIINNRSDSEIYEERRLFYVAITRTKNKVYLMVPFNNKSIFIKELIKDYKNAIFFLK